jgi:hypothetical protein
LLYKVTVLRHLGLPKVLPPLTPTLKGINAHFIMVSFR